MEKRLIIKYFFIMFAVGAILFWVLLKIIKYNNDPKGSKADIIGTVIGYSHGAKAHRSCEVEYIVDGINYSLFTHDTYVIGEKFLIEYQINNPVKSKIITGKPIFLQNEKNKIDTVFCQIDRIQNSILARIVDYTYFPNNKSFSHSYFPESDFQKKFPKVSENYLYKVTYIIDNPKRSIVDFSKPIKYFENWWMFKFNGKGEMYRDTISYPVVK